MKKLLALAILLGAAIFAVPSAEAQNYHRVNNNDNNYQYQQNRRRVRVVTQTRVVRVGRRVYRDTYRTRYLANGRVETRLISRVRVR